MHTNTKTLNTPCTGRFKDKPINIISFIWNLAVVLVLYCGQPTYTIYFVDDRKLPDVILENNFVNIHPVLRLIQILFLVWPKYYALQLIERYLWVFDHQNLHIHTFRVETLTQTSTFLWTETWSLTTQLYGRPATGTERN